jgi:magnesium transporter
MSEIVEGLGPRARERIPGLRSDGHFFWIDLCADDAEPELLEALLDVPRDSCRPLLDFESGERPSRRVRAGRRQVVFPFQCYVEEEAHGEDETPRLHSIEVNVLVHGDYLLTVHRERVSLPHMLPDYNADGRSEQYIVYAVLDAMVATAFDALSDTELVLEGLQTRTTETGPPRVRLGTLRAISLRLTTMRRQLGPQRGIFERIGEEIGQIENLSADNVRYFERVYQQLNRVVDGIDAASDSMAQLMDLRMNETMYWLTVVATIFLPLTFLTGFFGMNFGWMVGKIDTEMAFLTLGIGGSIVAAALIYVAIRRRGTPVEPDQDAVERLLAKLRRPLGGAIRD